MKKLLALLLSLLLPILPLCGCAGGGEGDGKLHIVTTVFPLYDWVREIVGENTDAVELTLLTDGGGDLHSYEPGVSDLIAISDCDLFLSVGGESDAWVPEALRSPKNPNRVAIALLDALGEGAKPEEPLAGEEDHDHDHTQAPYDEHIWLSLKNAATLCRVISDAIQAKDPARAASYEENTLAYLASLSALDAEYQAVRQAARRDVLLFGDRFPFRYLLDDYDLSYYAAFSGCSTETDATLSMVIELAGRVDELSLPCILAIEGSDHGTAERIRDTVKGEKPPILVMDSLQAVSAAGIREGASYLAAMQKNLTVLRTALG